MFVNRACSHREEWCDKSSQAWEKLKDTSWNHKPLCQTVNVSCVKIYISAWFAINKKKSNWYF